MPSRFGQTMHRHDDYKVQREFERKNRDISNLEERLIKLEGSSGTTKPKDKEFKIDPLKYKTGIVKINQLPLIPQQGQAIADEEKYKYNHYTYTPENGKYGWYVYKEINHGFNLKSKDDFIINLVDLHLIDDNDVEDVITDMNEDGSINQEDYDLWYVQKYAKHRPQVFYPEIEGLDTNRIILRGIYKPDVQDHYFTRQVYNPQIDWIDEDRRIVRTNLIFKYTIFGGQ